MIKIKFIGFGFVILLLYCTTVFGEAIPPEPGTVTSYASRNAKYTIAIKILGYPDRSPSECTYMESGIILWIKSIPTTPSKVVISDNGKYIAMTNWGWYDEGGSNSLSIYDRSGNLIKEASFEEPEKGIEGMKWIRVLTISPDGTYCMVGENTTEHAAFSLYDCRTGELKWEKGYGFSEAYEAKIANGGDYILIATDDYHSCNMQFFLLRSYRNGSIPEKLGQKSFVGCFGLSKI